MDPSFIEAVKRLKQGEVIGFPTETFFGLAADPFNPKAVAELSRLKSRPSGEGIPLIISESSVCNSWILENDSEISKRRLAIQAKFWPGPLSLVINPSSDVINRISEDVLGPDRSLALRVSSDQLARELARAIGGAITSTSANRRAQPPTHLLSQVKVYFPALFIIGADIASNNSKPSTILDVRSIPFRVLREGAIGADLLEIEA